MNSSDTTIVITTVQEPTACMHTLAWHALAHGIRFVVIGDRKGPARFDLLPAELFTIDEQRDLPLRLAGLLPERHYARKNIGYLLAMAAGAERIYETDDDNAPLPGWLPRPRFLTGRRLAAWRGAPWANVYAAFTDERIWPRGLPLDRVAERFHDEFQLGETVHAFAPIQQCLANGSPDVDAVWRLVLDRDFTFDRGPSVLLPAGVWCPFNSQNTWWWAEVFPLLYLPSYCAFRMTDIWRSFVAQRCLWALGHELAFHAADVHQDRNPHNLMHDFDDEVVGYRRNDEIRLLLEGLPLVPGAENLLGNIQMCYEALVGADVVNAKELPLVEAWLHDCVTEGAWTPASTADLRRAV